jgi:hypothetical protein
MASASSAGDGEFIRFMLKRGVWVARSCKEIIGQCHGDEGLTTNKARRFRTMSRVLADQVPQARASCVLNGCLNYAGCHISPDLNHGARGLGTMFSALACA